MAGGWDDIDKFLFNDARDFFVHAPAVSKAGQRERKLGEAVTLLNTQPRTVENINRAAALLGELEAEKLDDNADAFARFFLGRIAEMHRTPADLAKARAIYIDLLQAKPGSPLAEYVASKVVLIDLYANIPMEEFVHRIDQLETLLPLLRTPQGRREFHANIGIACEELHGPRDKLLAHLIAADKEGFTQWQTESLVWILIADAAEKSGDKETAIRYCEKFAAKYQRDNRCYTVVRKLQHLAGGQSQ
jgi:hypothetical protein